MLRLVTIHVTKGTPAYPVSSRSGQIHVQNSWSGRIRLLKAWFCVIHPSVRGPSADLEGAPPTTPPPSPPYFFPIRRLSKYCIRGLLYIYILIRARPHVKFVRTNGSAPKISGACQWCHLPLKITWHHRVVTWAPWRLRVHTCLFNNLSKQITKKTSKFRDPRLVTRDSRLKSSKVTSHEWRVGDSWLVTRDLGPPKSPVTSRGSRVGVANSPIVTRDYESRFLLNDLNHGSRMNLERCETRIVSCMF